MTFTQYEQYSMWLWDVTVLFMAHREMLVSRGSCVLVPCAGLVIYLSLEMYLSLKMEFHYNCCHVEAIIQLNGKVFPPKLYMESVFVIVSAYAYLVLWGPSSEADRAQVQPHPSLEWWEFFQIWLPARGMSWSYYPTVSRQSDKDL